jgi:hypothetical protein
LLNSERQACGFAPLARNAQLDAAARGHAHWNLVNNSTGHYQTPDTLDFTGINETDRASAAGYKPGVVEDSNTDSFGRSKATGFGELAIHSLLTAPYHLRSMVGNFRDVGIAVLTSDDTGTTGEFGPRVTAQLELGYTLTDGPRNPAPGAVLSYPCGGTTGTFARLANESPNPVPYRDLATSPLGQPIYLVGDEGKTLAVTSALVQEVATGNTVALLPTLTAANDPNFYIRSSEAIVIPDAPLKTNTQYRVTIVGTNDGISFTKTFNFTTGALADATDASL